MSEGIALKAQYTVVPLEQDGKAYTRVVIDHTFTKTEEAVKRFREVFNGEEMQRLLSDRYDIEECRGMVEYAVHTGRILIMCVNQSAYVEISGRIEVE